MTGKESREEQVGVSWVRGALRGGGLARRLEGKCSVKLARPPLSGPRPPARVAGPVLAVLPVSLSDLAATPQSR